LLNAASVESDVLSYGHYHIMGCPEWEEGDFAADGIDEYRPDFDDAVLLDRPRWFVQGPFQPAVRYLIARRRGQRLRADLAWRIVEWRRRLICGSRWIGVRRLRAALRALVGPVPGAAMQSSRSPAANRDSEHVKLLIALFRDHFPHRLDQLTSADVGAWGRDHRWTFAQLRWLLSQYDVVHGYGAEPILPLLARTRPYVAFEHGTLRSLPFEDSPEGRLVALSYREADAVLITNADNHRAADRLGISRYRFIPHPVSEHQPDSAQVDDLRTRLRGQLDADFVLFHPSRHHWSAERNPHLEKANDRLIEGAAALMNLRPRAAAVFVSWGQNVDDSRRLVERCGISNRVLWIPPQPGARLARYMAACDVVADQFFLGAFGSITPRAMLIGTPAMLYLDPTAHKWCFDELPPVINARTPREITDALLRSYDQPQWRFDLARAARRWYDRYHSSAVVERRLLETYRDVLQPAQRNETR
jgi:glycosyltransferase involved in cell wall biosynthesis